MAACYNLNQRESPFDGKTHVPCNMTAVENGGHSTCCPIGDYCLTNGMCKNAKDSESSNWYFRTACTDKTWNDPACPKYCEPIEPTRNTGLIFNCLRPESWCCAYVGEKGFKGWSSRASINTTCCAIDDLKFTAQDPIVYATATPPIKLSVLPSSSAAPTSTFLSSISLVSTVTSELDIDSLPTSDSEGASAGDADSNAQDQQASTGLSSGAKIGLGVGISLGVLALAALAVFFLLQRRRRRTTAASASAAAVEKDGPHLLPSSASAKGSAPPYQETQMGGTARYRYEAPSVVPVAELPASGEMAELPNPNLHQERK